MRLPVVVLAAAVAASRAAGCVAAPPHILFVVADDLGRHDISYFNKGASSTPTIDGLIKDGVVLDAYHTFKICSPSRASIHTGRYPWSIGWYDMSQDENHSTRNYTLMPQLLRGAGYSTHAYGKYDIGYLRQEDTATRRGYDDWTGYYQACNADYWSHAAPFGRELCKKMPIPWGTDLSSNNATHIGPLRGLNGTYSTRIFTHKAVETVNAHKAMGSEKPLFMYFAPQNCHLGCGWPQSHGAGGIQAPCSTVSRPELSDITEDRWKGQAGFLAELDWGVGNVTAALKAAGYWDNTLVVFVSDNGGPLPHSANYPLRGGKWSFFEGGVRVVSFLSGPALPAGARGSTWPGLAHSSDWLPTLVQGVAGASLPAHTGPRPLDGHNLWPSLTSGGASPRTEVIHQVRNQYFDEGVAALRVGQYKLIDGKPGDNRTIAWPPRGAAPVAWGQSGGSSFSGDRCYVHSVPGEHSDMCSERPCLFDVLNDPGETKDLSGDPAHAATLAALAARLKAAGATGPPKSAAYAFPQLAAYKAAKAAVCANMWANGGFLEPLQASQWQAL